MFRVFMIILPQASATKGNIQAGLTFCTIIGRFSSDIMAVKGLNATIVIFCTTGLNPITEITEVKRQKSECTLRVTFTPHSINAIYRS